MSVVELVAVSKRYGDRRALDDVSFSLEAGAALGLLGPNGAGKTTALRLLLGFSHPTSGTVRLKGRLPTDPESRVGVGYLPERLKLPARMTVQACLHHHAALAGLMGVARETGVDEVLERTRLAERSRDRIGSLSKGLAQRVGFAQALLGRPELMLLDEPTSGLDPIGVREARDWIRIAREWGCAVLVSSHLLSEVERTCDRIAILDRGRVVAAGELDAIVAEGETLEDAFVRLVGVE
jgi:ABC-2 type transport system ATP-binding protein